MKIETKYNPKDLVWIIFEGKAVETNVYKIDIEMNVEKTTIKYYVTNSTMGLTLMEEKYCFSSREDLINSL